MENTQRNYKIKSIRKYNREIEKTERDITKNTVLVGLTALATLVAYSSLGIEGIDIAQKIGLAVLGTVNIRNIGVSSKMLSDSIAKKAKLEQVRDVNSVIEKESGKTR